MQERLVKRRPAREALGQNAVRGASWSMFEVGAIELLHFLVFAVLARLLGPEPYGIVGLAMIVVIAGHGLVRDGGWIEAIVQKPDLEDGDLDAAFVGILLTACCLGLITIVAAGPFSRFFDEPGLTAVMPALALYPVLSGLTVVPMALLQRDMRLAPLALRSILACSVAGGVGIVLAFAGFGIWSLVTYELTFNAVAAIVLWRALLRTEGWRPGLRFSATSARALAGYVSRVMGERLLQAGEALVPRSAVGWAFGSTSVGLWSLARKVFDLSAELVYRPALRVMLPGVAGSQTDPADISRMMCAAAETTALLAVPGYVLLGMLGPEIVALLFGTEWRVAGTLLQALAIFGLIMPLTQLSIVVLHATGQVRLSLRLAVLGFILLAGLSLAALPFGLIGLALAFSLRGWLMLPVRLLAVRHYCHIPVSPLVVPLLRLGFAGALMALAVLVTWGWLEGALQPLALLAASSCAGGLVYLLATAVVASGTLRRTFGLFRRGLPRLARA